MSAGHTPGPWQLVDGNLTGSNGARVRFSGHAGISIGGLPRDHPDDAMMMAAPEMFDALNFASGVFAAFAEEERFSETVRAIAIAGHQTCRAALAAARLETVKGENQ